ncbi:3-oxoacyl-[acyl-carrier-protein] synthase III [Cyclonatronum proteinivorum]|uniref:Beta-ketoacyl-[acyl-carrier-protein] synthase III n=1 Tax=Cyclonatronum proteinivorum TaxID=1457365 RepID=A0A345UM34_9BACT|nr:beta-ketoacyl-ACP synthase III [Cyclonatronum proteinivorum]AXJ01536.1 3-oxoacyl-[acyl-carrier-protein] synthase III [Cyclonatronum proteinivorum]
MSDRPKATITALGHYLPDYVLTNAELEQLVDTNDEWIKTRTGISERRILKDPDKATAFMGGQVAHEILKKRGIEGSEIDCIIVATVTPDYFFPATACLIQREIKAVNAYGFDVSAACSGFLYALSTGAMLIESGRYKKVMVIGSDKMSSIVDYTDRTTCIIFGDAAAGVLLEPSTDGSGIQDVIQRCDGNEAELLRQEGGGSLNPASHETVDSKKHFIRQEGRIVFKKATESMADVSLEILKRNALSHDDVSWFVPHQANNRIISATAKRMGVSMDKVMVNIDRYGNTTAATIPLCLYEWQDKLKEGDNVILASFGGGFTWGSVYINWGKTF